MKDLTIYCFPVQTPCLEKSALQVISQNTNIQSDCRTLRSSITLEGMREYVYFLRGDIHQGKVVSEITTSSWVYPVMSSQVRTYLALPRVSLGSPGGIVITIQSES